MILPGARSVATSSTAAAAADYYFLRCGKEVVLFLEECPLSFGERFRPISAKAFGLVPGSTGLPKTKTSIWKILLIFINVIKVTLRSQNKFRRDLKVSLA